MGQCSKVRYASKAQAELALKHVQLSCRRRGRTVPTGSYWCAGCRSWHLTSKSPSRSAPWDQRR
jgi:hypothetical protein